MQTDAVFSPLSYCFVFVVVCRMMSIALAGSSRDSGALVVGAGLAAAGQRVNTPQAPSSSNEGSRPLGGPLPLGAAEWWAAQGRMPVSGFA